MAGILQAIGQSNINQSLGMTLDYLRSERNSQLAEKRMGMEEKSMESTLKTQELQRNQAEFQIEDMKKLRQKININDLKSDYPFADGESWKFLERNAKMMGIIDAEGYTTKGDLQKFGTFLQDKDVIKTMSKLSLKDAENAVTKLEQMSQNPDALKQSGINAKDLPGMIEKARAQRNSLATANADYGEAEKVFDNLPSDVKTYAMRDGLTPQNVPDPARLQMELNKKMGTWKQEAENEAVNRAARIAQATKTVTDRATPSPMRDFELTVYGKETPEKRGTPEYQKDRLKHIRETKEQSPYVEALEKQAKITAQREGTNLRKEFNDMPEVKEAFDIKRKFETMQEAMKESKKTSNFVAVDQAIITLYNKMTDPQSVVRESEYARTGTDLALWHRVKGKVSKWMSGGAGLTQDDREAVFKMAKSFQDVSQKKYKARLHEYKGYLTNYGLDADQYLTPYGKTEELADPLGIR